MVVTIDGSAENKFTDILKCTTRSVIAIMDSIREVITRRLKHLKTGRPDLIIIDGEATWV